MREDEALRESAYNSSAIASWALCKMGSHARS